MYNSRYVWYRFQKIKISHRKSHQQASSKLIEKYTSISQDHLTPEIKLRLIVRGSELWNQPVHPNDPPHPLGDPYWAFYWPGGQALNRYILDHPAVVKGKKVLDFGSGSGAGAIAALLSGAKCSLANDIDSNALASIKINGSLNNVTPDVSEANLIGTDCLNWDVVLVGDMLYDVSLSEVISAWLSKLHQSGKTILIGDPGRGGLETCFRTVQLFQLAKYELDATTKEDNYGFHQAHVFTLH